MVCWNMPFSVILKNWDRTLMSAGFNASSNFTFSKAMHMISSSYITLKNY